MRKYKIKHRSLKHDNIETGWYVYGKTYARNKNGRAGFKRRRISGPFTRGEAIVRAGIIKLKFDEFLAEMAKRLNDEVA